MNIQTMYFLSFGTSFQRLENLLDSIASQLISFRFVAFCVIDSNSTKKNGKIFLRLYTCIYLNTNTKNHKPCFLFLRLLSENDVHFSLSL